MKLNVVSTEQAFDMELIQNLNRILDISFDCLTDLLDHPRRYKHEYKLSSIHRIIISLCQECLFIKQDM